MAKRGFEELLRTALQSVPGYDALPAGTFPTVPLLTADFGQQQLITTFALHGPPPPALISEGDFPPAVSLHVTLPDGYWYWQPETGNSHYVGGVPTVEQLPPAYLEIVLRRTQELAATAGAASAEAAYRDYLPLLEQLAHHEWLLDAGAESGPQKALAQQLRPLLDQLTGPAPDSFYRNRGRALYAWLGQATYERPWAERALDAMRTTIPDWVSSARNTEFELHSTVAIPAVLDGRQCLVTAFYQVASPGRGNVRLVAPPFGACGVSYPDIEVVWGRLVNPAPAPVPAVRGEPDARPYLVAATDEGDEEKIDGEALAVYWRSISLLLEKRWLMTRYAPTTEEISTARAIQHCIGQLFRTSLQPYYQQQAWQLHGWLARVAATTTS